ncbi:MAG: J domain-containing protein [Alphaproteobacteria bacterium]|nr:J domain-containing protein [Alphaproteobacteria bacterium]
MNLNSPLFDKVRVKPARKAEAAPATATQTRCDHPGCQLAAEHRAPMGRNREGQFFNFCLEHVREYNQTYNYFKDMSDDDVARYQKDAITGHRPTWTMGARQAAQAWQAAGAQGDPFGLFRSTQGRAAPRRKSEPRLGIAARKALAVLGLEESADAQTIRARYKDLVKRFHPDANGGDRSREEKLREIIQAYKQLRAARLA